MPRSMSVEVYASKDWIDRVERYQAENSEVSTRSEAIRDLVEIGLHYADTSIKARLEGVSEDPE